MCRLDLEYFLEEFLVGWFWLTGPWFIQGADPCMISVEAAKHEPVPRQEQCADPR
jgi:hypothetical protein